MLNTETTLRTSQIQSISVGASTSFASFVTMNSAISSALLAETTNRNTAISNAIQNILSGAPARFNTLEKIASELNTNTSLTINASTLNLVSTLKAAVSNETVSRVSAIASLSNAAIPGLSSVHTGMSTALSTETVLRNSAVASLSSDLSSASVSFTTLDTTLSQALSTETVNRNSTVASVSTAVLSVIADLNATDATLSTALSTERSHRVSAVASIDTTASLAFSSLNASKTTISTAISTEISRRLENVASTSGLISASFSSLQSVNDALKTNVSTLSAGLALKATTTYLDEKVTTLLAGAPSQLNTLAEMAAALGNNATFASSITTALATKGTVSAVNSLSAVIATKGDASQLVSLASVVGNAATNGALSSVNSNIVGINDTVNTLASAISVLQTTGGTASVTSIAVNGVDIPTLATRIQELYYKLGTLNPSLGTINPDGTVNYKVNRLIDPVFVSSTLGFEYNSNGAVTKVKHIIVVKFDKDQKSATVTGGAGNPTTTVNNMVLDASGNHTFNVAYNGNVAFYTANKTAISIVALETQYKAAPLVPTITVNAIDATDVAYKHIVPTVTNKTISTSVPNIFSIANPPARYHAETFPDIGAMPSWDMSIYFYKPSGGDSGYRGLVGSSYFNSDGSGRNWGVWISNTDHIVWGWQAADNINTTLAVELNVNYNLKITKTTSAMKFDLKNINTGVTQTQTSNHSNPSMGIKQPVTIGGWISSAGESGAVISALHVGSYTNTSNYNTPSTSGINVYSSSDEYIKTVTTPGSGVFADSVTYEPNKLGSILMKVSAAGESSKSESDLINVSGEDTTPHETPALNGSIVYSGTIANATYTLASNVTKVSVFTKTNDTGPTVTGIAMQYTRVGYGVEQYGNWYGNWAYNTPGVHYVHYRLRFSNGIISNLSIYSDSPSGLTNPDISFALTNIPAGGVTAILQGRNNNFTGNVWYDIVDKTIQVTPSTPVIKFYGNGTNQFVTSPAMFPTDTVVVSSATVTTPGTITLAIPYTAADVGTRSFYVVADADTTRKQSAESALQPFQ